MVFNGYLKSKINFLNLNVIQLHTAYSSFRDQIWIRVLEGQKGRPRIRESFLLLKSGESAAGKGAGGKGGKRGKGSRNGDGKGPASGRKKGFSGE
jgi:hypothetical protein